MSALALSYDPTRDKRYQQTRLGRDVVDFLAWLERGLQLRRCAPETDRVVVINGKGGRDRIVPMSLRLRNLLADVALVDGLGPTSHIFYRVQANEISSKRVRDKPVGEGTFARWWRRCLDDAGVRYRTPHTARHTFATTWRQRGLSVDEIQILLGHASIRTTADIYVHTSIEDVAARMQELTPEQVA